MSTTVRVDIGDLQQRAEAAAEKAAQRVMDELNAAFQQSFTANAWDWPRDLPTRKLNGANLRERIASYQKGEGIRAGSPRNLIDNANPGLRGAHYWEMTGAYTARFVWWAPYATFVHEGGVIWAWGRRPPYKGARAVLAPPRPWTRAVLGTERVEGITPFPLKERLTKVWLAYLKTGRV